MRTLLPVVLLMLLCMPAFAIDPAQLKLDKLPVRPELPDPLVMFDGSKITNWKDWQTIRKPELRFLFQELMYGQYPTVVPKLSAKVLFEDINAFDGLGTLREVALTVAEGHPPVHWLIALPKKPTGKVPMFIGLNFYGNHCLTTDERVRVPDGWMYPKSPGSVANKASAAGRGKQMDAWPIATILKRGYGLAVAYNGDIIPDDPKVRGGLCDLLLPKDATNPNATATVMAWAWGIHRGVDHLLTLPEVDATRITVVGHSRLGKAAMVAGAFDERISVVIANQAGCGGTAPNRRTNPKSEPVARINTAFPHWFNGNYKLFNEATDKLPFDQHALVALCAPRPVLFTCATDDVWADPPGQFRILQAAAPVYTLAGVKDAFAIPEFPEENKLVGGTLGYWIRPGKHAMSPPDWETYLTFASRLQK